MNIRHIIKLSLLKCGSIFYLNNKSKLLYYHDICDGEGFPALDSGARMATPLELFKKHVETIRREGYEIVPRITKPDGQVVIMLDDGFRGIYACRQYFYDNNISPTIFLPVAYIGQVDKGIMTEAEILELQEHGFRFECHGWSHEPLTKFADDVALERELGDSKVYLSRMLGRQVNAVCMPLGYFSDYLLRKIKEYGYEEVYSCIPGNYDEKVYDLMLRRNLCQFASPEEVKLMLRGGNEMLKERYIKLHYQN
jgi:hypothetical protein